MSRLVEFVAVDLDLIQPAANAPVFRHERWLCFDRFEASNQVGLQEPRFIGIEEAQETVRRKERMDVGRLHTR